MLRGPTAFAASTGLYTAKIGREGAHHDQIHLIIEAVLLVILLRQILFSCTNQSPTLKLCVCQIHRLFLAIPWKRLQCHRSIGVFAELGPSRMMTQGLTQQMQSHK
jgi:hypothetical protein